MKVSVEKQPNSMVKLTIEVEAELFNHGLDHAFEEEVKLVEVKGFRKGKVPRATFEKCLAWNACMKSDQPYDQSHVW